MISILASVRLRLSSEIDHVSKSDEEDGSSCFRSDYPLVITNDFPVFCIDFHETLEMANLLSKWEGFEPCYDLSVTVHDG